MITRGKETDISKRREAKEGRTKELKIQLEVMAALKKLEEKDLEESMEQDYGPSEKQDESGEEYSKSKESQTSSSSNKDSTVEEELLIQRAKLLEISGSPYRTGQLTLRPKTEPTQGIGIEEPVISKNSSPEIYVPSIPSSVKTEDKSPIIERDNMQQMDWIHWRKKKKTGVGQASAAKQEQPKAESSAKEESRENKKECYCQQESIYHGIKRGQ
ncbi:hypothetical protein PPACK8108_LOCUS5921 [Phakopsora pachyrhizi]|uniref:Uncharacterized protein n=1 Tax=Phakopsora pachyrhizi TaxID=170000 RepID=A0AAV0APU0_PHAPC|nr:hypothetical protein PPACK8108_LOCUS5921 [Phakopsora pachyrhizi]